MAAVNERMAEEEGKPDIQDVAGVREPESFNVNLRRKYPLSYWVVIKRTISWICLWLIGLVLTIYTQSVDSSALISPEAESQIDQIVLALFIGVSAAAAMFVLYEVMYRTSYYYAIKEGHLVVAKGVVLRQRGSFPLSRITDVYLTRTFGDFIFGLYDLHISTPTTTSGEFAKIDGLGRAAAVAFQRDLTGYIEAYSDVRQGHLEEIARRQSQTERRADAARES